MNKFNFDKKYLLCKLFLKPCIFIKVSENFFDVKEKANNRTSNA